MIIACLQQILVLILSIICRLKVIQKRKKNENKIKIFLDFSFLLTKNTYWCTKHTLAGHIMAKVHKVQRYCSRSL